MNTLILQRCIKLINSDSKDLHCFQKILFHINPLKRSIQQRILKKFITVFYGFLERV